MSSLEIKHTEIDVFCDYNIVVTATTVIGQGADSNVFLLKGRPRQSQAGTYACMHGGLTLGQLNLARF